MLCNAAINIANIESGKITLHILKIEKLFKMLDFLRSSHIYY